MAAFVLLLLALIFLLWLFEGSWWAWLIALILWIATHPGLITAGS